MGHLEPFDLRYVAVGNEECRMQYYRGNYLKFYDAMKHAYPEIMIISNCDASLLPLDHPADYYDFHLYTSPEDMFLKAHKFDAVSRSGPKAFVSEYAVRGEDAGAGNLLAALGEAGFLIGLEKNSDVVEMACYAPLFMHTNNRRWIPSAIIFNSSHLYGTPSYWMQQFFVESSGATLLNTTLSSSSSASLAASAITWTTSDQSKVYLEIKVVNFTSSIVNIKLSINGLGRDSIICSGTKRVLTSDNVKDENSFQQPKKVVPIKSSLSNAGKNMDLVLSPYLLTSIDLLTGSNSTKTAELDHL